MSLFVFEKHTLPLAFENCRIFQTKNAKHIAFLVVWSDLRALMLRLRGAAGAAA